jgi:D-alanyl-D-alanine carboxypeptidase
LRTLAVCRRALAAIAILLSANAAFAATYSGIVVDAKTGKTLYAERADALAHPASLTKMMTLYLLFEAMDAGKVARDTRIVVSAHAASMQPSKLGIKAGGSIGAEQAILAVVTKSANDIAVAIGEHLAGSEAAFAERMTRKARALGMSRTTFRNASGLPNGAQVTTARDMATLGIALREHFPEYYRYFSARSFAFGRSRMANHNRLLGRVAGVDGIKTGYTRASGYNLVSSVRQGNRSIVAVVLGGKSGRSRNQQMQRLIAANLPKASVGADRMVVARAGQGTPVADKSAKVAPKIAAGTHETALAPEAVRIEEAHAAAAVPLGKDELSAIEAKLRQIAGHGLPVPARSPEVSLKTGGAIDETITASIGKSGEDTGGRRDAEGWQIQIGAAPDRAAAIALLDAARAKAGALLASRAARTETVDKNGATLHRARFAGFASQAAASDACHRLKKLKIACFAVGG